MFDRVTVGGKEYTYMQVSRRMRGDWERGQLGGEVEWAAGRVGHGMAAVKVGFDLMGCLRNMSKQIVSKKGKFPAK